MGESHDPGTPEPKHRPLKEVLISNRGAVPGTTGITHIVRGVERYGDRVARNELERGGMDRPKTRASFHSGYNKRNQDRGPLHVPTSIEPHTKSPPKTAGRNK